MVNIKRKKEEKPIHIRQQETENGNRKVRCRLAVSAVTGYGGSWTISHLLNLKGNAPFSDSFFSCLVWIALTIWLYRTLPGIETPDGIFRLCLRQRREALFSGFLCLLAGVLYVAGYQLQFTGYTDPGIFGKSRMLLQGAFLAAGIWPVMWKSFCTDVKRSNALTTVPFRKGRLYLGCLMAVWVCWIPVWLAYYPVIMSYDFHKQSLEALWGPAYFNNHHPLAHTYLIYLFRCLGEKMGSFETGFALFSLFQQLMTVMILAYACVMIYRLTGKKWAVVLSVLFFGLFPLISVFVMCTTKDVLFGAFFLLFLLRFIETMEKTTWINSFLWICSGVLMVLFRNNALYAMAVFGLSGLFLVPGKRKLQMLVLALLLFGCGKGALWGLQTGFHAYQGSSIEKYSVLYQTMARVGKNQKDNLSEQTYTLLDTYVTDSCWEEYNPVLADTIKGSVQQVNFGEKGSWSNLGEVLKAWCKIGIQYPNDYLDAFLDLTRGYWFLDDTAHAQMLGTDPEERMGLLYTYNSAAAESLPGMTHRSYFPELEQILEKLLTQNCYQEWPVVSTLFKPALWCLLFVYGGVCFWCKRDRKGMLLTLYPLAYFGTMLLGPTAIIRYVYPFILSAPLLLAYMGRKNK